MNRNDRLAELVELERQVERDPSRTEGGWKRLQSSLAAGTLPNQVELSSHRVLRLVRAGRWARLCGIGALGFFAAAGWVAHRHSMDKAVNSMHGASALGGPIAAETSFTNAYATPVVASEAPMAAGTDTEIRARARTLSSATLAAKSTAAVAESRTPATVGASSRSTFEEELRLIKAARESGDKGQIREATALLNQHARQFPNGVFADEREALCVLAACRTANSVQRPALAAGFGRAYPRSPYSDRVKRACQVPDEK